jgi:CheY-like chemotaxis protein
MSYGDSFAPISDLSGKVTGQPPVVFGDTKQSLCNETQSSELGVQHSAHYLGRSMAEKTKILIIEDEPGVSLMMAYLLTQAGCEAQTAWNAERGIKLAQTRGFDLIALEMNMPGGFEICSSLKENPFFQTPIVFVSNNFCEDDVQRGRNLGVADFIQKPFEASDFVPRILSLAKETATA